MIVSRSNPQLRWQVRSTVRKDPHPFVGQGMKEIDPADEKKSCADKDKISVFVEAPRIPDDDENPEGHQDAEHLDEAMEEKVAVKAREGKPDHRPYGHDHPWPKRA